MLPLDDFTIGRIALRRRFGVWIGTANIRNARAFTVQRKRRGAQNWAARLMLETDTRVWSGLTSPAVETMSLCDFEAVR